MPPTATRTRYVTIGGVLLATRAINVYDFAGLYASPEHRDDDFIVPGVGGVTPREAVRGPLRALLGVRVDGQYDHTTDAVTVDHEAGIHAAWQIVHDLADVTALQTLNLYVGAVLHATAQCRVLELTSPRQLTPTLWDGRLDVFLPAGALL